MHRVQQERANTYSKHIKFPVFSSNFLLHYTSAIFNNSSIVIWLNQECIICMNGSYPHKTAALCAGCILQCTCRLWWSGRWEDTAGNSLHCYYCRDWCLGTQKHENEYTKQNQRGVYGEMNRCALDKQATRSNQNRPSMRHGHVLVFSSLYLFFILC